MTTRSDQTRKFPKLARIAGALALCIAVAAPVAAQQSPFTAAVTINNRAVTYYEISQRVMFLQVLNAPGNLEEEAREQLINERLQQEAGARAGNLATPEQIESGMEEFAARANMNTEAFLGALQNEGVAPQTFRDFVSAGQTWRNVVRQRFGPRVQISEDEIDRALTLSASADGAQINFAELIIPITPQNADAVRLQITQLSQNLDGSIGGFSAAARQYSRAGSAGRGGGLGWRPLSAIPPQLRALLLPMEIGGVTDPVPLGAGAVAIFQLRGLEESEFVTADVVSVDYAEVLIPGGASALEEAEALRDDLDTCDDLYGVRPGGFNMVSLPVGEVPTDISVELARLDANEVSTRLTRAGGTQVLFLMLCARGTELPEGGRDQVREALFQQRIGGYANGFLAELHADAIISENP